MTNFLIAHFAHILVGIVVLIVWLVAGRDLRGSL